MNKRLKPVEVKTAIAAIAREWADVYKREPDGEMLVRALLAGIDNRLRERLGLLSANERERPSWAEYRAFGTGRDLAEDLIVRIHEVSLRAFYAERKSGRI